jgi:hypothetical protein
MDTAFEQKKEALRRHILKMDAEREKLSSQLSKAEKGEEFDFKQGKTPYKLKYSTDHKAAIIKILQNKAKSAELVIGFLDKEFFTKEFGQELEKELIEAGNKMLEANKPSKRKDKTVPAVPAVPEKHK